MHHTFRASYMPAFTSHHSSRLLQPCRPTGRSHSASRFLLLIPALYPIATLGQSRKTLSRAEKFFQNTIEHKPW